MKDRPTIDAMEHVIVIVGLVRKLAVINEHIEQMLVAFLLWINTDRGSLR
jgi:hypothetical protein